MREVAGVARRCSRRCQWAELLAGVLGVLCLGLAEQLESARVACRRCFVTRMIETEEFVAILQVRILDGDLGQAIRDGD